MSKAKKRDVPTRRVSPTGPKGKSISAGVWEHLENDVPGFKEAMETGTAQIKAGKGTRLKDWHRGR